MLSNDQNILGSSWQCARSVLKAFSSVGLQPSVRPGFQVSAQLCQALLLGRNPLSDVLQADMNTRPNRHSHHTSPSSLCGSRRKSTDAPSECQAHSRNPAAFCPNSQCSSFCNRPRLGALLPSIHHTGGLSPSALVQRSHRRLTQLLTPSLSSCTLRANSCACAAW
jgi:hypothetical protein